MDMLLVMICLLALTNAVTVVLALHRPKPAAIPPLTVTPQRPHGAPHAPVAATLSPTELTKLEKATEVAFAAAVERATTKFNHDLDGTSERLNQLIVKLTTDVVETELVEYRKRLNEARTEALESLATMQKAVDAEQTQLQSDMKAEIEKHKDILIERLDQKLGQAVVAYVVESLGQGADLGAQRTYILESLERGKAALKKDLRDGL